VSDPAEIRAKKDRSNRAVLVGVLLMILGLAGSATDLAPELLATAAAVIGFAHLMYGVHVGWQIFYDRESDGPAS
jgi:hypothetical protein